MTLRQAGVWGADPSINLVSQTDVRPMNIVRQTLLRVVGGVFGALEQESSVGNVGITEQVSVTDVGLQAKQKTSLGEGMVLKEVKSNARLWVNQKYPWFKTSLQASLTVLLAIQVLPTLRRLSRYVICFLSAIVYK